MRRLLWVVGLMSCLGLTLGGLHLFVNRADDSARASACQGCLSCIAVAMHKYHEKYGRFPPAYLPDASGRPAHSWRVLLLEFLDYELYMEYKFDQPWNGPNNRKLEERLPSCYTCPADREGRFRHRTNYFVVVGEQTVFPGPTATSLKDVERPRNSTILVVEAVGQDIHWMEPRDLSFDSMSFIVNNESKPSVSGKHKNGPNVCMVDGTKRRLTNITQEALKEMLMLKK